VSAIAIYRSLVVGLERIGWQLLAVDIDLDAETARIEMRRGALCVTFDAQHGRASITRDLIERETVRVGRRGDSFRAERIKTCFLGRERGLGLRSGLRALSHYVADNAAVAITHEQARNLFRPLLARGSA
jgi:hypothetical protein